METEGPIYSAVRRLCYEKNQGKSIRTIEYLAGNNPCQPRFPRTYSLKSPCQIISPDGTDKHTNHHT